MERDLPEWVGEVVIYHRLMRYITQGYIYIYIPAILPDICRYVISCRLPGMNQEWCDTRTGYSHSPWGIKRSRGHLEKLKHSRVVENIFWVIVLD